jgi:hypothetical protein
MSGQLSGDGVRVGVLVPNDTDLLIEFGSGLVLTARRFELPSHPAKVTLSIEPSGLPPVLATEAPPSVSQPTFALCRRRRNNGQPSATM